jgi:hypothetical protein
MVVRMKIVYNKKWWAIIIGSLLNSVIYGFILGAFAVYPMEAIIPLFIILALSLVCLYWLLCSESFGHFFIITAALVFSFFLIGFRLAGKSFRYFWEMRYPGQEVFGEANAEILVTMAYIIMGIVAWIFALVTNIVNRSLKAQEKKEIRWYVCASCGKENETAANFCVSCGLKLKGAS